MQKVIFFLKELVFKSISIDIITLNTKSLKLSEKIELIIKKYYLVLVHIFLRKEVILGQTYINIFNTKLYFDSKYGLAGFQTAFSTVYSFIEFLNTKEKKVIVDIGANVGNFSYLFAKSFKNCEIFSIEPIPEIFETLKLNMQSFKNVKTFNCAIGETDTRRNMSYIREMGYLSRFSNNSGVEVSVLKLDSFVKKNNINKIDLLKIDVESFENLVLEGASETLKNVKYMMIEVSIFENENYTFTKLMSLLSKKDYDFQLISINTYSSGTKDLNLFDCILFNTKFK
jgi:FkbM family methyltransferase